MSSGVVARTLYRLKAVIVSLAVNHLPCLVYVGHGVNSMPLLNKEEVRKLENNVEHKASSQQSLRLDLYLCHVKHNSYYQHKVTAHPHCLIKLSGRLCPIKAPVDLVRIETRLRKNAKELWNRMFVSYWPERVEVFLALGRRIDHGTLLLVIERMMCGTKSFVLCIIREDIVCDGKGMHVDHLVKRLVEVHEKVVHWLECNISELPVKLLLELFVSTDVAWMQLVHACLMVVAEAVNL